VLFNSGVSRSSADVIREQIDNLTDQTGTTQEAMHSLNRDTFHMIEWLLKVERRLR